MPFSHHIYCCFLTLLVFCLPSAKAQTGFDLDIKKPEPYENRELRAERTGQKKFTIPRRIFQNTYTHYNYFFNANNKLNEVIERAKESHREDYAELLPFYNYSLETTAQQRSELDSVIYKSKTGIVMHDLRNDWIDDMYLLWGAAYYLQKEFDSAYQMFQFINYAFADKEKDGYYRFIGSRLDGSSAQTIVTKEDDKLLKRMISDPPARNNAFIWQVRTLIEANAMVEAGSLITTLKNDPNFPGRLNTSLEEVQAYWYYKQARWDSAAVHLTAAFDNAKNKQELARWQYLAGQLFEKAGQLETAKEWYGRSINNTTDPVMDIYARLNLVRINKEGGDDYVNQNIAELSKMARREKYVDYRDVIYFMMAQMELERNDLTAAHAYLQKGAQYYNNNPASRNRTYLHLADLSYKRKQYAEAASYYDSLQVSTLPPADAERVNVRKGFLGRLVSHLNTYSRQDSMQRIAALPEEERTDYLKKLARQLRRQQGLKEDETVSSTMAATVTSLSDPFGTESKGEWYFYNKASRERGAATFRQVWGNRPNADNWRRGSSVMAELRTAVPENTRGVPTVGINDPSAPLTYETLLQSLPLTPEQIIISNDSIQLALATAGYIYLNEIEDYPSAIQAFEELRKRFPYYVKMDEVLFHLYYAYLKTGDKAKAEEIKGLLLQNFPASRHTAILKTGIDPLSSRPSDEVTRTYEGIYDMFIEGRFEEAKVAKHIADSIYKTNYWSPQLLYIESVYHIRQNEDSTAIQILNRLIQQDPQSAMSAKATTLLDVLRRRKQIEEELRNLQIERPVEEVDTIQQHVAVVQEEPQRPERQMPRLTGTVTVSKTEAPQKNVLAQKAPESKKGMVEAPNAPFIQDTVVATVPDQPVKRDTIAAKPSEIVAMHPQPTVVDTTSRKPVASRPSAYGFTYETEVPHYAVVILHKVDNIFGNEARNAFNRFNRENYSAQAPGILLQPLDGENKLLLIGTFSNILQAVEYVQKASPIAGTQIVPWLKAEKYSFTVISKSNLEVLQTNPNLDNYKKFLEQYSKLRW